MDRLANAHELLDGPLEADILDGNLRDLRRINRWLGGARLSVAAVRSIPPPALRPMRIVDVGTGGADIPLALVRGWRGPHAPEIVAVDERPEVLASAVRIHPELATTTAIKLGIGDGTSLPFDDDSFDVAHASLVLHHLDREDAVAFLRELRRVATRAVVINDLDRGRLHLAGAVALGRTVTRNRYTRNDAPLSVRRAWRVPEVRDLLHAAGLRPTAVRRAFLGHRYAVTAVRQPDPT